MHQEVEPEVLATEQYSDEQKKVRREDNSLGLF